MAGSGQDELSQQWFLRHSSQEEWRFWAPLTTPTDSGVPSAGDGESLVQMFGVSFILLHGWCKQAPNPLEGS